MPSRKESAAGRSEAGGAEEIIRATMSPGGVESADRAYQLRGGRVTPIIENVDLHLRRIGEALENLQMAIAAAKEVDRTLSVPENPIDWDVETTLRLTSVCFRRLVELIPEIVPERFRERLSPKKYQTLLNLADSVARRPKKGSTEYYNLTSLGAREGFPNGSLSTDNDVNQFMESFAHMTLLLRATVRGIFLSWR